ncbi:hypothetical protein PVW51_00090 [Sulfitobacter sp. PR48]|uniref:hypothetical protein n=1 Tax=unclassified Sulfitobacter TaxID=196795 RepID=UPI0022AEE0B8|nr:MULTISPECIES: hypothetical protein [unclassified Sulfitobacter]MCZ4256429.1 hypothetical protein [Sulfitobacter sp. G21635-S1]MDD9719069.1 hypothetical protein [Sulfitobacter sp. PR48]GLT11923.1 hypothetical protein GCM10007928_41550 [Sulfitobacter porphyrae]
MLKSFSKSCIALAALTAISLPLTEANAKQTRMVVRNDPFSSSNLVVPKGYYPPAGSCRLWYPDRAKTAQPAIGSCDVVIPLGAVLLLG